MSYSVSIVDPVTEEVLHTRDNFTHYIKGGTYSLEGTSELWISITYNYAKIFSEAFKNKDGIKSINNKNVSDAIPILNKAISSLKDDIDNDYWKATEGNAKKALKGLLALCEMRPDGMIKIL